MFGRLRGLLAGLRGSFAAKLLIGGLLLSLILVGAVAGYLIYSRNQQTTAGALSNSDNRAGVMRQVLELFTGKESFATARGLAAEPPLEAALSGSNPGPAVKQLFDTSQTVDLSGEV